MGIADEAFRRLFPEREFDYTTKVKYSRKFSDYNANVKYIGKNMEFGLSYKWREVSKDIKLGLIQSLLAKVFKTKKTTTEIELYNIFLQKVHISVPKHKYDSQLGESFERMNTRFFSGMLETTNFEWAGSINKLGSYEYGTDTISISRILSDADIEVLDYIMYHEMLHKKHKFRHRKGKSFHHTREFRKSEKEFPDAERMENELKSLIKKHKLRRMFGLY